MDRGDTVVEEGRGEGGRGGFVGVFWDVMLINMGSRCKYIVARAGLVCVFRGLYVVDVKKRRGGSEGGGVRLEL